MSKILYNGVGYDPIVATDHFSGTVTDRVVWTPHDFKDAHINSILVSMDGPGRIELISSAGDPITGKLYSASGTTVIGGGSHELYVAPSGITINCNTITTNVGYGITIYAHEK